MGSSQMLMTGELKLLMASNHTSKTWLAISINLSRMQLKMSANGVVTWTNVNSQKLPMTFTNGSEMFKQSSLKLLEKQLMALLNSLETSLKTLLDGSMTQLLMPKTLLMALIALKDVAHKTNHKTMDLHRQNSSQSNSLLFVSSLSMPSTTSTFPE